ncbi:hypothetical protein BHE74_00012713 [Ensete ventricosum]|nr:hypothetical protein BHE74_00012713 [Ensete ventricosum]
MLHPGVTQEWVDEGKLPRERTKKRIDDGGGPTRCWQRPHMEKSYSEFITRESVYNGDVTKRRHGVADRGGIVHGNATHADMSLEGHDHAKRRVFVCALELVLDESLSHQHMGAVYNRRSSSSAITNESHGGGRDYVNDQELLGAPLR